MSADDIAVAAGRDAWARLRRNATYEDWICVGRALAVGRAHAMKLGQINRPFGRRYSAAIGAWLRQHDLDGITGQERHRALWVFDRLDAIERWRTGLDEAKRRRLNHPNAVWAHYCASLRVPRGPARPAQKPQNGIAPPVDTQMRLARAADAVFDCLKRGCNDSVVIARAALDAAERSTIKASRRDTVIRAGAQIEAMP